jgi:YegS/Rv2252/BmrU family lipid kinase
MKKKIAFIINPKSGTSDKKNLPEQIKSGISLEKWEEPTIIFTKYAGHGKELTRKYVHEGYDVVVACGGDGTMNEVASELIGTNVAFGLIPFGSGNGLARHLDISMSPQKAIYQINNGEIQTMDYGLVNEEPFFCTCGTGFDAHISHTFAHANQRGFFSYLKLVVREYFKYKSYRYKLEAGDTIISQRAFLVTFANASQFGNMGYIAPHANTQDGLLDICILSTFPVYSIPRMAWQLFMRKIDQSRHVSMLQTRKAVLHRPFEGEFHIDGEAVTLGKKIEISIVPKGLRIIYSKLTPLQKVPLPPFLKLPDGH